MDINARVNAIKGIHLFPGLPEEKLRMVAENLEPVNFAAGEVIFRQDDPGDACYVIVKGKVEIIRRVKKTTKKVATLVSGDYFGETALVKKSLRNATAQAETDVTLLKLPAKSFQRLRKELPRVAMIFDIVADSRRDIQRTHFEWLDEGEVVYYLARRHVLELVATFAKTTLLFIPLIILLFLLGGGADNVLGNYLWGAGGILLGLYAIVVLYQYVDWGNDYYAVTNRRVVMKEKVIGVYESRSEALLSTVRAVSVETSYLERLLDSGSILITTYISKLKMKDVEHPRQVASMIEEYWQRTRQAMTSEQKENLRKMIRERINPPPPAPKPVETAPPPKPKKKTMSLRGIFSLRIESEGSITYHKHWLVLLRDSWTRLVSIFIALVIAAVSLILSPNWAAIVLVCIVVAVLIAIYWVIWDYGDWNNDLYMVTSDKIIDVYRQPFGDEERKDAPLTNIQTIEYKRNGIIGTFFNFGDVKITMGGSTVFDFTDVADPPRVQTDISRRLNEAVRKKQEADALAERNQMLNFIADYHNVADELRRLNPQK